MPAVVSAATGPQVSLPDKGTYYWWESSAAGGVTSPPKAVSGKTNFTLSPAPNGGTLTVLDARTGEVASLPAPAGKTAVLLTFADFHTLASAAPAVAAPVNAATAAAPHSASEATPPAPADTDGGSIFYRAISWIFAVAVLAGVIWLFKRIYDTRGKVLTESARKLGVDVPDPDEIAANAADVPDGKYVPSAPRPVDKVPDEVLAAAGGATAYHAWGAPLPDPIPHLVGLDGPAAGQRFDLPAEGASVGREAGNEIVINDPSVSRRHAAIQPRGSGFTIADNDSANGVFVNGLKVSEQPLQAGDTVQIGRVRFRYEDR